MAFWALLLGGLSFAFHIVGFLARRLRRAKLEFEIPGFPEIGFSWLGPTINFWTLFRVTGKDTFVRRVRLAIENLRTHERHNFSWLWFNEIRHDPLSLNALPQTVIKEIAAGFYVTTANPDKMHVLFHDDQTTYTEMRRIQDNGNEVVIRLARELDVPISDEAVRERFNGSPESVGLYADLGNVFYWREAEYQMTVLVETDDGVFTKRFSFTISADDSRRLDNNRAILSAMFPADAPPTFQFAYPRLNKL